MQNIMQNGMMGSKGSIILYDSSIMHRVGADYTGELFYFGKTSGVILRNQGMPASNCKFTSSKGLSIAFVKGG